MLLYCASYLVYFKFLSKKNLSLGSTLLANEFYNDFTLKGERHHLKCP